MTQPSYTELLTATLNARLGSGLSPESMDTLRVNFLDALGCILYGATLPESAIMRKALGRMEHMEPHDPFEKLSTFPPEIEGLLFGFYAHLRELDDVHYTILHTGAVCSAAVLAVARHEEKSIDAMLEAYLLGIEASVRIARSMDFYAHRERGWHGTSTCGAFGAAFSAARLLGLTPEQTVAALGIAGGRTGGTWSFAKDSALTKRVHPGFAARDGIVAAYMAREGITGPRYVLEAEDGGFYRVTTTKFDPVPLTAVTEKWAVEEVEYKWYPACKSVHSPIEACLALKTRCADTQAIDRVLVEVNASSIEMAGRMYEKGSVMSAQLSIPYGVAVCLSGGNGTIADYAPNRLMDERIYALAQKVDIVESEAFNRIRREAHQVGARVTVTYRDGTSDTCIVTAPKGSKDHPLTKEQLMEKYLTYAAASIGELRAREWLKAVYEKGGASASDIFSI